MKKRLLTEDDFQIINKEINSIENRIASSLASKTELNNYVEKVDGKVLSTNDFTNAQKTKVDRIPDNFIYDNIAYQDFVYNAISIENAFSKEADLYKYLNARTGLEFTSSIQTLDDLVNSETAMVALASSEVGMKDILNSTLGQGAISNSEIASKTITSSNIGVDLLFTNSNLMKSVVLSKVFCDAATTSKMFMERFINETETIYLLSEESVFIRSMHENKTTWEKWYNSSGNLKHKGGRNEFTKAPGDGLILISKISTYMTTTSSDWGIQLMWNFRGDSRTIKIEIPDEAHPVENLEKLFLSPLYVKCVDDEYNTTSIEYAAYTPKN